MPDDPPPTRTPRQQFDEAAIIAARNGEVFWYPGRIKFDGRSPDKLFSASVWISDGEIGWSEDWGDTGVAPPKPGSLGTPRAVRHQPGVAGQAGPRADPLPPAADIHAAFD